MRSYRGKQMCVRCGAICLIALFVALSNQERSASKQLAPGAPYTHLLPDLRLLRVRWIFMTAGR